MKKICLIMALFVMSFVSCKPEAEKATVETRDVTDVTSNSAKVVCNVADDGGSEVSNRGVCWDTSGNPTIETASSMVVGTGTGNYECEIVGLESNTTYYVKAYATNEIGTSYGEVKNFTTSDEGGDDNVSISDPDGEIAGYGYVDLGLPSGKKWAIYNVGASSPEDYGDYFAWGETSPKAEYDWDNSVTYGYVMNDISGNAQYDAASANWGGSWRMPTKEEMEELEVYCEWEWTQVNGVNGMRVVGPNGSCIFLPAAGYRFGSVLNFDGSDGVYWSSLPSSCGYDYYYNAYSLNFSAGSVHVYYASRNGGLTVRPISE